MSPHVTIYDFPASALTSIANRVTGVALVAGKRRPRFLLGNWLIIFIIVCPMVDWVVVVADAVADFSCLHSSSPSLLSTDFCWGIG